MKRMILVVIALAAVVGLALAQDATPGPEAARTGAPRLAFAAETITFDRVEAGAEVPAEFDFRNDGDADLIVTDVRATCDCTEARAEPATVPPGGEGRIFVVLDTSYRVGDLNKEVVIESNDPDRPSVTLHLKGQTYLPVTLDPNPAFIANIARGKPAMVDVALKNTGDRPVTVKQIMASDPDVTFALTGPADAAVALPLTLEPGGFVWIRATILADPGQKDGVFRQIAAVVDPPAIDPVTLRIQVNYRRAAGEN